MISILRRARPRNLGLAALLIHATLAAATAADNPRAPRDPAAGAGGEDPPPAIGNIAEIERDLATLAGQPDVRRTARNKTDLPPGEDVTFTGEIRASAGIEIEKVRHWTQDGSPYGVTFSGVGLLRLDLPTRTGAAKEGGRAARDEVLFVTASIKPALAPDPEQLSYVSIAGAVLAFGLEPPTMGIRAGRMFVLNGGARKGRRTDWVDAGISYPVTPDLEAGMPLDVMLRIDFGRAEWDLFFRHRLHYAGIHLGNRKSVIWLRSSGQGVTEVSELAITVENPLFPDADRDGIEDALETALGFSAAKNDRLALDELGKYSNLQHFIGLRKTYPSRQQVELEATLVEAIAAEKAGQPNDDLAKRAISADQRKRDYTEQDWEHDREELRKARLRFGRTKVDEAGKEGERR